MTTTETSPLMIAREICIFTMNKARCFQAELGVPEGERCELPKTFKLFRKIERIQALTAEYTVVVDKARTELEARDVARKPVVLSDVELMAAKLAEKSATEAARKAYLIAQAEAYRFQKLANVPMEQRNMLPKDFKSFDRAQYEARTAECTAIANELRAMAERKVADDAKAKADAETEQRLAKQKADLERRGLAYRYRDMLDALARRRNVRPGVLPFFRPSVLGVTDEDLRALVEALQGEHKRLDDAEALEKKRRDHEQQQKLLKAYNDARCSGRAHQSFDAWSKNQQYGAMRRTG